MRTKLGLAFLLVLGACSSSNDNNMNNNNADAGSQPPLPASVSLVEPSTVFLARTLDVHLSGFATMWTDQTTISFGDKITVNKVTAASATGLTANITIDPAATVGPRDVTVMDGSNTEIYKATFNVAAPINVTVTGTLAQGSITSLHAELVDHDNFFDTTAQSSLFGTTYTNLAIKGPSGVNALVTAASPTSVDALLFTDVNATAGAGDLEIVSGPAMGMNDIHDLAPGSLTVTARTAATLPTGMTTAMVAKPFDSGLYTFAPGATTLAVNRLVLTNTGGTNATPAIYLLPKSGSFLDGTMSPDVNETFTSTTEDPYYVIISDQSGDSGYSYTLNRDFGTVTGVMADATKDNTSPGQSIATLPGLAQNASFNPASAADNYFSFTVPAGQTGKKAHIVTFGDAGTTLAVNVASTPAGTPSVGMNDNGGFNDFTTSTLTAGATYYIHVSGSTMSAFGAQGGTYNLWLRLE